MLLERVEHILNVFKILWSKSWHTVSLVDIRAASYIEIFSFIIPSPCFRIYCPFHKNMLFIAKFRWVIEEFPGKKPVSPMQEQRRNYALKIF